MMTIRYNPKEGGGGGEDGGERRKHDFRFNPAIKYTLQTLIASISSCNSKIIFALSSQGRILTLFIPVLFARLCIRFHLSRNESCCVVQNFESLICRF